MQNLTTQTLYSQCSWNWIF